MSRNSGNEHDRFLTQRRSDSRPRRPRSAVRCDSMNKSSRRRTPQSVLGWREWVSLDGWAVPHLKAKVDTGARTSSLHAFDLDYFERDGADWVRFEVHPWQRSASDAVPVEAPIVELRKIKSSTGDVQRRPVVLAAVSIAGERHEIEVTLTNRDEMGFRMLLGRQALRGRFLVDPGSSYRGGRPPKSVRLLNRQTS